MIKNTPESWDNIYQYTPVNELTWYEHLPLTSIRLIAALNLPKDAAIIDVGGGGSKLAKYLLALGYENITILDFSTEGIKKGRLELGELATMVKWIHADVLEFEKNNYYDLWHDRATFNFITNTQEQMQYIKSAYKALRNDGHIILGSFSNSGPSAYNDFAVKSYSAKTLSRLFGTLFENQGCIHHNHITPLNDLKPFIYCWFKKFSFM